MITSRRSILARPRLMLAAVLAALVLVFGTSVTPKAQAALPTFAPDSPFNLPIASAPSLDPRSGAMIAYASRANLAYANLYEYGIPVLEADRTTPRVKITCTMEPAWGSCPLSRQLMPMPADARPNAGSDGVLTVIDTDAQTVGEYWQAHRVDDGHWETSWGAINSLRGSGWGGGSTGAGASRLAGVVRVAEMQAGSIPHALVIQTDNVCADVVRPPAIKTDGDSHRADCIPEGARLQLDPSVNVDSLPGINRGERIVAKALQTYGAYVMDRGGASMSISFELATDASRWYTGWVYDESGFTLDYYGMPHIPWSKLRVLRTWQG